ncbi:MAG: hypothetical protein ABH826_04250 [Patescibacteria group bacterium]
MSRARAGFHLAGKFREALGDDELVVSVDVLRRSKILVRRNSVAVDLDYDDLLGEGELD